MEQQKTWLNEEAEELNKNQPSGDRLPSLKLEENKMTEFDIDFSKEFEKWIDPKDNRVKKIIPVTHNGQKKVFWIAVNNPLYRKIIELGSKGVTHFKIVRTGQQKDTRYALVE
jgi:hypothetical protein